MRPQLISAPALALVIDSNAGVGQVVARMLAHCGIDAVVAHSSREAERVLAHDKMECIAIVIAEVDGAHDCCANLLQRLRRERQTVKLICLTPHGHQLSAPMSEIPFTRLTKPFTADDLRAAISA